MGGRTLQCRQLDTNPEPTEGIQTNFEKKYRLADISIYRMVFEIEPEW